MSDSFVPPSTAALGSAPEGQDDFTWVERVEQAFGIPHDEAVAMMEAVKRGEGLSDYFGFSKESLNSFENAAVALYSQHQYEQAEQIFLLLVSLSHGANGSFWRGAAACRQGQLDYKSAIGMYSNALLVSPEDTLSGVYLAECYLTIGQLDSAQERLAQVLEQVRGRPGEEAPHIKRARAMLDNINQDGPHRAFGRAQAKAPLAQRHLKGKADEQPSETQAPLHPDAFEPQDVVPTPESDDPEIQAMLRDPQAREKLEELTRLFEMNAITLREIADFSQEQMDAGYAACCALLEQRQYARAMEMCGWMLHIDAQDARLYQLGGLCAMNLGLFCLAEHLFNMDSIWRKDGADAATLIYKGEAHLRQDEPEAGLAALAEGISLAGARREYQQVVKRAQTLQRVYSAPLPAASPAP